MISMLMLPFSLKCSGSTNWIINCWFSLGCYRMSSKPNCPWARRVSSGWNIWNTSLLSYTVSLSSRLMKNLSLLNRPP